MMKRRIVAMLMSALLLCSCADTPKTGRPSADDSSKAAAVTYSVSHSSDLPSADADVLYDRCGVKVRVKQVTKTTVTLEAVNSSDSKLTLHTLYAALDGVSGDAEIYRMLKPGESRDIELDAGYALGELKGRLYLTDESFGLVENSLSDTVTLRLSDIKTLRADPLCLPLCENDTVKLGVADVGYVKDRNSVYIRIFGENKTDRDIFVSARKTVCVHEDFSASLSGYIPAGGKAALSFIAVSSNETISGADLDSISFDLDVIPAERALNYDHEAFSEIKDITLELPKAGRPEVVIPETLVEAEPVEEFRAENLSEYDTELFVTEPVPSAGDGNITVDYAFSTVQRRDDEVNCRFFFLCTNRLDKQIALNTFGIINGATVEFVSDNAVKPMHRQFIEVSYSMPPSGALGDLKWAKLMFEARYDDGHSDSPSVCRTKVMTLNYGVDSYYRCDEPKDAKLVYEDDSCRLYFISATPLRTMLRVEFFAVNKTDKNILIIPEAEEIGRFMSTRLLLYGSSCTDRSAYLRANEDEKELTPESIIGSKLKITVCDEEYNVISEGEGTL